MTYLDRAPLGEGALPRNAWTGGGAAPRSLLPPALWSWVLSRDARLIVLSFDHALSRFLTPRRTPRLAPALIRALRAITESTSDGLIIHSATGVDQFRGLLRNVRAHLIGEHGWEECTREGRKWVHPLPGRTRESLETAARAAEACGWGPHLARRRCSLLLGTDGLPADQAGLLQTLGKRLWSPAYETDGLRLHATAQGPELRATERSSEGAIAEAVRQLWPSATMVHLGLTGDSPRSMMQSSGRRANPVFEVRRSGALDVRLHSCREISWLLEEWPERCGALHSLQDST